MVKQLSPMGRAAQPEELARGMLYMVSDDASFVTGSLLTGGIKISHYSI
jgi:hypothetical protein